MLVGRSAFFGARLRGVAALGGGGGTEIPCSPQAVVVVSLVVVD